MNRIEQIGYRAGERRGPIPDNGCAGLVRNPANAPSSPPANDPADTRLSGTTKRHSENNFTFREQARRQTLDYY